MLGVMLALRLAWTIVIEINSQITTESYFYLLNMHLLYTLL